MMHLEAKTLEKIEQLIPRYPTKRSAMLIVLHLIQVDQGYISKETIEWVAEKLEIQPINVYEVVTFYPMFRQAPIGKTHLKVCRTLSCALRGAYSTCDKLQELLNCPLGGTSPDGEFTVEFVECLASCHTAPVVQVDDNLRHHITPESVSTFIEELKELNSKKTLTCSRY